MQRLRALVPGVQLVRQEDGVVTLAVTSDGLREELSVDPQRGRVVGSRELVAGRGPRARLRQDAGTVITSDEVLAWAEVGSADERP
jgi:hypothetical protein